MVTEFNKNNSSNGNPIKKVLLKIKNLTPVQKKALLAGTAVSTVLAGWGLYKMGGGQGFLFGSNSEGETASTEQITLPADVQTAGTVNDSMSFEEAFAQSRKELGAGGLFDFKGNLYNNFTYEEWDAMSSDQKSEYLSKFEERISNDPQEIQHVQDDSEFTNFDSPSDEMSTGGESDFDMPEQNAPDDTIATVPDDYPIASDTNFPSDPGLEDVGGDGLSASDLASASPTSPALPTADIVATPTDPATDHQSPVAPSTAAAAVPNTNESGTPVVAASAPSHLESEMQTGGSNPTLFLVDADKNHIIEARAADFDHDGFVDLLAVDTDQDGIFETIYMDLEGTVATDLDSIGYDKDGDGKIDHTENLATAQVVTTDTLKPFEVNQDETLGSEITTMDDPLPEMDGTSDVSDFEYDINA